MLTLDHLHWIDNDLKFPDIPAPPYEPRRMSSSAASESATTDDSLASAKRPRSPDLPSSFHNHKRPRPTLDIDYDQSPSPRQAPPSPVQLPSIFETFDPRRPDTHEFRRGSLPNIYSDSLSASRVPRPPTAQRTWTPTWPADQDPNAPLASYQFPAPEPRSGNEQTAGEYSPFPTSSYSTGTAASSAFPSTPLDTYTRSHPPPPFDAPSAQQQPQHQQQQQDWPSRPTSTAGHLSAPASSPPSPERTNSAGLLGIGTQHMFGNAARISGHAHESRKPQSEEWFTPSGSFVLPSAATSVPSSSSPSSGTQQQPSSGPALSPGVNSDSTGAAGAARPPRRRGKLPKPTTDFLKDWLHRHSDHPYPSEEEKKQLCNATGLSMSQVSNWMINARRRILAPANRAAQGPTTTLPFPNSRSGGNNSLGLGLGVPGGPTSAPALSAPSLSALSALSPLGAINPMSAHPGSIAHLSAHGGGGGGGYMDVPSLAAIRRASMPGPAPDHHLSYYTTHHNSSAAHAHYADGHGHAHGHGHGHGHGHPHAHAPRYSDSGMHTYSQGQSGISRAALQAWGTGTGSQNDYFRQPLPHQHQPHQPHQQHQQQGGQHDILSLPRPTAQYANSVDTYTANTAPRLSYSHSPSQTYNIPPPPSYANGHGHGHGNGNGTASPGSNAANSPSSRHQHAGISPMPSPAFADAAAGAQGE
ncbi:hypothetical protein BD410DRAFT_173761 [Rickenella mellea]|uniref:Homeobox domain-containing protein n=1 Tax=Rickenella mellea TaxID=50990 RepID=A0A4Y7Q6Z7_9AGAM|nr:hypothetical protein BD410DRAFT_173761 [Rickenella mellea]